MSYNVDNWKTKPYAKKHLFCFNDRSDSKANQDGHTTSTSTIRLHLLRNSGNEPKRTNEMRDIGIHMVTTSLAAIVKDLEYWNHRTNEPASSPQEPVVQSACNRSTLPEQPALVVQDGTEPSDRKALSVQSAETLSKLKKFIEEEYDLSARMEYEAEEDDDESYDSGFYSGRRAQCVRIRDRIDELLAAEKWLTQVEHEAKRLAAD